jgi:polyphosphate kinase 2 (PPK2 family)
MFELTIVADDVAGLISQMQTFISAFSGTASSAVTAAAAHVKAAVVAPHEPEVDPPQKAEKPEAVDEKKAESDNEAEEAKKALTKMKDDALVIARDVFAAGKDGAAAVRKLPAKYGVKKLQDVPVEKAAELLAAVKKLQAGTAASA